MFLAFKNFSKSIKAARLSDVTVRGEMLLNLIGENLKLEMLKFHPISMVL